MTPFNGWENFYIIVGSSAGALIGLQFVVMTLIADMPASRVDAQASGAFATPSVVHFGLVLLLSVIVMAPWRGITIVSILWGIVGLCGFVYTGIVIKRMRKTFYKPVFEDWLFHALLPFLSYLILAASAYFAQFDGQTILFLVGVSVIILLFTGIHNAWDAVTYNVFVLKQKQKDEQKSNET